MPTITVWIAYNTDDNCFASHEGAQTALDGLIQNFWRAEGTRVVEMELTLPEIKPVAVKATIPDTDGPVTVTVES